MTGSLRALLEAGVAKAPDKVMISADGVELTWSRLMIRLSRRRSAGARRGQAAGSRDLSRQERSALFEVLFGCALAGAVLTPLNWRLAAG